MYFSLAQLYRHNSFFCVINGNQIRSLTCSYVTVDIMSCSRDLTTAAVFVLFLFTSNIVEGDWVLEYVITEGSPALYYVDGTTEGR